MNMPDAVRNVLSNYATFNGRARRSEYWWWALAVLIVSIVANVVDGVLGTNGILGLVVALGLLVPNIAVGIRRLHDTGRAGWWILIGLVPLVGFIVLIVFYVQDSGPDNQYGPNPKGAGAATGDASPYHAG